MLRIAVCLTLLLGALCPLAAQPASTPAPAPPASASATNAPLTLGPEVLTFPEIAQQLSVGGHKVTCSPALEQYAAYVSLKNRSWDKTRHVLEQGLQMQFHADKDNPNAFTLEWDSDTRRRERAWFTRFAGNLLEYLQEQLAIRTGYLKLPPDTLKQQYDSATAEIAEYEKNNDVSKGTSARYRQLVKLFRDMNSVVGEGGVDQQLGLAWAPNSLPSAGEVMEMARRGSVYHIQEVSQIPQALFTSVVNRRFPPQSGAAPPQYHYFAGAWGLSTSANTVGIYSKMRLLSLNEVGISLQSSIEAYVPPHVQDQASLMQFVFEGVPEGEEHRFSGLGKPALQWLQSQQKQTRAVLAEARLRDAAAFDPNDGVGNQSRRLEAWSRRSKAEAMIVVWPQRESGSARGTDSKKGAQTASQDFAPADQWALHTTEGVLCAQNLMAFVDRERVLPVAALIRYGRSDHTDDAGTPDKAEPTAAPVSAYEKLLTYCRSAANTPVPFWHYPLGLSQYRDIDTSPLDQSVGALFLWECLPMKERQALLEQARKAAANPAGFASVALTRFDPRDRAKLARILQGWGMEYAQASLPGFADALSGCMLYVSATPMGANKPYHIRLEVISPDNALIVWGCKANFLWQP